MINWIVLFACLFKNYDYFEITGRSETKGVMRIKGKGSFKRWQQSKKEKELVDEYEEEFESYNFKQVKQAISHKILIYLRVGQSTRFGLS